MEGESYPFTAEYDAESQMTSLEYTDSSSVVHRTEYRYSGDGFLAIVRKFEGGSLVDETRIVRDGFLAIQDRDENNAVEREYTWGLNLGGGIGGLLNLKQGGQDYAYLYDGKGNVAAVLDGSQSVVAAYRYAPFGKLLVKTGSLEQPFGFSTKRYDAQAGLIHYQYRSYAPEIGRWLTRDPLGEAGGLNLYAFVGNTPVNWVDPWGLSAKDVENILNIFHTYVAQETAAGRRHPLSWWNNFSRSVFRKPYKACGTQWGDIEREVLSTQFENKWSSSDCYNIPSKPEWSWHVWGVFQSDNPNDPIIIADPWKNIITQVYVPQPGVPICNQGIWEQQNKIKIK